MEIDAIILAGGDPDELDEQASCKGLVSICAKPMVEYVADTLRSCPPIRRIVVVMPRSDGGAWQDKVDEVVISDGNIVENFAAAVGRLSGDRRILVLSADVPLVTCDSVLEYLGKCAPFDADLYYPIVPRRVVEAMFPGVQRTYMGIREGTFTGGNVMLLNPQTILKNKVLMESVFDARKSPLRLVRILGLSFIVKFLLKRLTIDELERKVSALVGGKGRAVIVESAEIGFDVDKPTDLEIASSKLAQEALC